MKKLPKTLTVAAIASLVAAAGISFAQTETPVTKQEARAEGAAAARSLPNRLDGSGSQGSRQEYTNPTVQAAPVAEPAPVVAQPTVTETAPAIVAAPEPAPAAAPVAEPSTEVAPVVERAPQADRN
jgi:hypothetical protein